MMPATIPKPPPLPSFFKKERPCDLDLARLSSSSSLFTSSSGEASPFTPISNTCTTPELKTLLTPLKIGSIENIITYGTRNSIKNGQNGVVNKVTLSVQGRTRELVKKQGSFSVEHENKMTEALQNVVTSNFPVDLFALPVAQGSDGTTNILYTCYQEIGDLETHLNIFSINMTQILVLY